MMATLTVMQIYFDVKKLKDNEFLNIKMTQGRGDITKLNLINKNIFWWMKVIILIHYL